MANLIQRVRRDTLIWAAILAGHGLLLAIVLRMESRQSLQPDKDVAAAMAFASRNPKEAPKLIMTVFDKFPAVVLSLKRKPIKTLQEVGRVVKPGETYALGPYQIAFKDIRQVQGPNYLSSMADLEVTRDGVFVAEMHPEKRSYTFAGMGTTEAAIRQGPVHDIYIALGDVQDGGGYAVRSYLKPFANWLWFGEVGFGCRLAGARRCSSPECRRRRALPRLPPPSTSWP